VSEESVFKAQRGRRFERPSWLAVGLIAAGLGLLAVNIFNIDLMEYLWPAFIVGPGLVLLLPAYKSTSKRDNILNFLAIPGAMMVALGSLMFLMNLVDHFESMAYIWPLVISAGVVGLMYMERFDPDSTVHENGHRFIRVMVMAFMGSALFFEVLVFESLGGWWPMLLVGLGVYVILKNRS
jgi:hypothetical protein